MVLNNLTQLDAGQSILLLNTTLDVDKTFLVGLILLRGVGQQVLKNLTSIIGLTGIKRKCSHCSLLVFVNTFVD